MTADFCCSCEVGAARAIIIIKEHYGLAEFIPYDSSVTISGPSDAAAAMANQWAPWRRRFLSRNDINVDGSDPANNRDYILAVDRLTGQPSISDGGTLFGPNDVDVQFWLTGPYAHHGSPGSYTISSWDRENYSETYLVGAGGSSSFSLSSEYTLGMLDADCNDLLDAFAPGDVGPGQIGGAAYDRVYDPSTGFADTWGQVATPPSHYSADFPYIDPGAVAILVGADPNFDPNGWGISGGLGISGSMTGSGLLKGIIDNPYGPGGPIPKLAAYSVWVRPGYLDAAFPTVWFFPNLQGQANKMLSWIPVSGKYTRSTFRRNRDTGITVLSVREHLTGSGLIQTLAPALDPECDIWINVESGWIGDETPSTAQSTDSTASDTGSTADPS